MEFMAGEMAAGVAGQFWQPIAVGEMLPKPVSRRN